MGGQFAALQYPHRCSLSVRQADRCVSTGVNCTLPTTTTRSTSTTTTTTTPLPSTSPLPTAPTTKPTPPTVNFSHLLSKSPILITPKRFQRRLRTRPYTPPRNGFRRTQSTSSTRTTPTTITVRTVGATWKTTSKKVV